MRVRAENYPALPDDPEPGEYRCPDCRSRVTVGKSGIEYGHSSTSSSSQSEDCPRRPHEKVDPRPDQRRVGV